MTEPVVPEQENRPELDNAALVKEARDWANVLEFQQGKPGRDYGLHAPTFADLLRKLADALARPALPAPEPPLDSTNFGLLSRATELLRANEREYSQQAACDWYLRDQRVLALVCEVTTRGAAPAPPDPKEPK